MPIRLDFYFPQPAIGGSGKYNFRLKWLIYYSHLVSDKRNIFRIDNELKVGGFKGGNYVDRKKRPLLFHENTQKNRIKDSGNKMS